VGAFHGPPSVGLLLANMLLCANLLFATVVRVITVVSSVLCCSTRSCMDSVFRRGMATTCSVIFRAEVSAS
jgi:hypothetical protein